MKDDDASAHHVPIGILRRVAFILGVFDLPIVHRSTVRALLPPGCLKRIGDVGHATRMGRGASPTKKNLVTKGFQDALREFEEFGWITRGSEFVKIHDHGALLDYAFRDLSGRTPDVFPSLQGAVLAIEAELQQSHSRNAAWVEQRRRELLRLKRLMESGFGSCNWSGRGSVRLLPRGGLL